MKIWLIHLGELLPTEGNVRLSRYGIWAEMLSKDGLFVTRWAPTFIHASKTQRFTSNKTIHINSNYEIEFIYETGYKKHISFKRFNFHVKISKKFRQLIETKQKPDIIICGMPIPEICRVAITYAKKNNIPIIIDVRDLWPDIYLNAFSDIFKWLGKIILIPLYFQNKYIFKKADGILAICSSYLDWGLQYAGRRQTKNDKIIFMGSYELEISKNQLLIIKKELEKSGVNFNNFICSFSGTLGNSFNIETIITAAKYFFEKGQIDIQFVLSGDGEKFNYYKSKAQNIPNIVFLGWIDSYKLSVLLKYSKIGLAPYTLNTKGALPNKLFDYLSNGLPIMSSTNGELKELIESENFGIHYNANDVQEFINGISKLKEDESLRLKMSNNSRKLFDQRFSNEKIKKSLKTYLKNIKNEK